MERPYRNRNLLIAAVISVWFAIVPNVAAADECRATPALPSSDGSQPRNLGILKLQLLDYKCFGAYERDIKKALLEAQAYVTQRKARADPNENLAVVLDIDETSVSNWKNLAANDFGFFSKGDCTLAPNEPCGFDKWIELQLPDVIQPTLDLFNLAKSKDIKIFFISARREDQRAATIKHLNGAGYKDWDGLTLKQPTDSPSVAIFKTTSRENIENGGGYIIIANVGDQDSDLAGGHAERTFKVPNPFYFIP
jgi:predicted secreted acid phosphatase